MPFFFWERAALFIFGVFLISVIFSLLVDFFGGFFLVTFFGEHFLVFLPSLFGLLF